MFEKFIVSLCMSYIQETNNQQPSVLRNKDEGSETIPSGSTSEMMEAVNTLTDNAEGKDIVQKNTELLKSINISKYF